MLTTPRTTQPEGNSGAETLELLNRGELFLAAGNLVDARVQLEQALNLQPGNEKGKNLLGLTYFKLGQYDGAAQLYEGLVQENPADTTLRVNLGLVYLKTNALSRAIHEFATAIELVPDHRKAHNYLGLALAQSGQYERAREHFVLAGSDLMAEKMAQAVAAATASGVGREPLEHRAVSEFDQDLVPVVSEFDQPGGDAEVALELEPLELGLEDLSPESAEQSFELMGDPEQDPEAMNPGPPELQSPEYSVPPVAAGASYVQEMSLEEAQWQEEEPRTIHYEPPLEVSPIQLQAPPSEPMRPPPFPGKLSELAPAVQVFHEPPAEPFVVQADLVEITISGELLTRLAGLISYSGVLDLKPERKRFRGRLTDRGFGEGDTQMNRARGQGVLLLNPGKQVFLPTELEGEAAYFREDVVFAFEDSLLFENGRLPSEIAPDLDLVYLRGKGRLLLSLRAPPRSLEVSPTRPLMVPLENLVGWFGSLTPRISILNFDELGNVLRAGVELSGHGFVLFHASMS
jgi:tetratricopeptide (TPR) repeat protein/uncharacterized protein (AIM24 family)